MEDKFELQSVKYYKCPKLCYIFCKSDEITYQSFAKKIEFKRDTMLGEGGNCCDS